MTYAVFTHSNKETRDIYAAPNFMNNRHNDMDDIDVVWDDTCSG